MSNLFIFGLGYSAQVLACRLLDEGWLVSGTCRTKNNYNTVSDKRIRTFIFDRNHPLNDRGLESLKRADYLLVSIPPDETGDVVLNLHRKDIFKSSFTWVGYLSTVGVYGNTGHRKKIDETAPRHPTTTRGKQRKAAENDWLNLYRSIGLPLHLFRLAGIYGPKRNIFKAIRNGHAKRIDRPGHLFSRIHVEDIATAVCASMAWPNPGTAYNITDDLPIEPSEVTTFACNLLGMSLPPLISFEEALKSMSPMAKTFWRDRRYLSNARLYDELGITLRYPTYREGLQAILKAERS